jgi:hypothetical protein
MFKKSLFLLAAVTFMIVGCGGSGSSSAFDLFSTAEKTLPAITPSVSSSSVAIDTADWTTGHTLYSIYQLIRSYDNTTDNGKVDGSNMHKSLYDANTYVAMALQGCTNSDGTVVADHKITEQAITSPFDFGSELFTQTYNCAYTVNDTGTPSSGELTNYTKSFAVKYSGGIYSMLMGWYATQGTTTTPSVLQVESDTTANTIKINNAYLVDYGNSSEYAVRIHVEGNTQTHLFSLKLYQYGYNTTTPANGTSIAGHGYSEGDGKYYLFRVTSYSDATPKYFCFASTTTEDQMKLLDDAGSPTVPTNCADLNAGLPDNYLNNASEVPTDATKFTGGGTSHIELTWTK